MSVTAGTFGNACAINIRGLRKTFEVAFALGPLSLRIPRGAICALVGPNGAGKTTLLNLLVGIGRPDAGTATVLGYDIRENEVEVKRRVAYVSPELSYNAWGTVGAAIDFISGFYPDWNSERCTRLLDSFGLQHHQIVETLSFGSRIKLSTLLALSRNAELLLLDEPTVGLDPLARRQLFSELLHYMRDDQRTIVISSHQLSELERLADHVAVMQAGQIVTFGPIPDLLDRYVQLDVQIEDEQAMRALTPALKIIDREQQRARLLLDRSSPRPHALHNCGIEVIAESALTLEELVVALTRGNSSRKADLCAP